MTGRALDDAALERLRQLNQEGQPDVVREVLTAFLADGPRRLAAIDTGLGNLDTEGVHRAAHALKGAASSIGATTLTLLCRGVEEAASTAALDRARDAARRLHEEAARVCLEIHRILGSDPPASASARAESPASYGETSPKRPDVSSREGGPVAPEKD